MSETYHLCCDDMNLELWIGQSPTADHSCLGYVYGTPEAQAKLTRFLNHTRGHPLVLRSFNELQDPIPEEFEPEDDD